MTGLGMQLGLGLIGFVEKSTNVECDTKEPLDFLGDWEDGSAFIRGVGSKA